MDRLKVSGIRAVAAGALCLGVMLSGCAGTEEQKKAADSGKPRVALVMKSLANEFFKTMEDGARDHQQQHRDRYELIAQGIQDERDINRQHDLVEQMIAQKVDAIVIAPADSRAMVGVSKEAMDAGIVVVNIDNKFDAETLAQEGVSIPFVGPDNRKGARMAAEYLAQKLEPGDKVAIVEGIPTAFNAIMRKRGFEDAMKAAGMAIVDSQSAHWETSEAEKVVSGMVSRHADLKAVLCANDSMALGAVAALRAAGKLDDVFVVGFDNISAAQEYMKEGAILCTVDQHADQIAVEGIIYALDILAATPFEVLARSDTPQDKETSVDLVTAGDIE